jgi:hypothetical protein
MTHLSCARSPGRHQDNSGDPIVVHDQLADRWILTQSTTLGPTYYNCVAVSTTPDATGSWAARANRCAHPWPG